MILVTGGAGYIGSHTVVELLNDGFEVIIADNYSNSSKSVIDNIITICGKTPIVLNIDLSDPHSITKLEKYDIKGIIHFSAHKAVNESIQEPLQYYDNNIVSLINMLKLGEKLNISHFIFSSSATVYGEPQEIPIKETHPVTTTNSPYGTTKIMGEKIIEDFSKVSNISFYLLRYFNPIGAHPSGLLGDNPNGIPNNLLPYVTQVAIQKLEKLNVFGGDYNTKDGTCIRDFIHVIDLAKGHIKALKNISKTRNLNVYNLGTGLGTTVIDLIKTFERVNNVNIPYEITERRVGDIESMYSDASLANNELNWQAELTIEDMLTSSWNFQKNISNE